MAYCFQRVLERQREEARGRLFYTGGFARTKISFPLGVGSVPDAVLAQYRVALAPTMISKKVRIASYSPGIVGLGHLRRNLLISQTLAQSALYPVNLIVAEARE